jgi:hypothetical protein
MSDGAAAAGGSSLLEQPAATSAAVMSIEDKLADRFMSSPS